MEDYEKKINELHDFFLKPTVPGTTVTRAQQLDELLRTVQSGKLGFRIILWFAGAVVSIGAAMAYLQSGGGK